MVPETAAGVKILVQHLDPDCSRSHQADADQSSTCMSDVPLLVAVLYVVSSALSRQGRKQKIGEKGQVLDSWSTYLNCSSV